MSFDDSDIALYTGSMSLPILTTKLYVPQPRPNIVLRPRLIERMNEGFYRKLTLISAPAGFGKTTLVTEWIARYQRPSAWISLDESDSDPTRFLTYLVAALQTIASTLGTGILDGLQSSQPVPLETLLTVLLNEISTFPEDFILVLDDYHVIDSRPVDHALTFLLEHMPPRMHLVITTREDPNLPLARLRVRDQLTELRATDLRFTPTEAAEFLSQVMNLDLSVEDVVTLENRTEGWIAGLQLAALSMRGRNDIAQFVQGFAGNNLYIVDYLVEEVLHRQPEGVRSFLLQTAILDRLNGSLCDAVTGQENGSAQLEALVRGNFFVIPMDDKRQWYRYHHLFADVLLAHLMAEQPDQVPLLHRRASAWYEHNGVMVDAVRHALTAQDFGRAAGLIEQAAPAMRQNRQETTLLGWLKALPDDIFQNRPVLCIEYVGALLSAGELVGAGSRLRDAERWLDTIPAPGEPPDALPAEVVFVNEDAFRHLPAWIALYHAALALVLGNVPDTVTYARQVLDLAAEDDHLLRGAASAILGLASWTSGDLETAYQSYADGMTHLQMAGNITDVVGGAIALADIRNAQGRLREAMRVYERALLLATEHGNPAMRGTADMYVGMSALFREYDDLSAARQHLLKSREQGEHTGFPQNPYRWRVAMARIHEAEGDLENALALLQEAERLYVSDFYPNVRPVAAIKARLWVAQGRLSEALNWAREQGLSVEDNLSYLREFEHITLARILLAQVKSGRTDRAIPEAIGLLERLLKAAEAGGRTGHAIEILVLLALARQMWGDIPGALAPLERALMLAEPEGYIRVFVDEGAPMASLLEKAAKHTSVPHYAGQLLTALGKPEDRTPPVKQTMLDPLSERELDVLRLLGTDLTGPEIARELMVSLNTVRTHIKSIYTKLGVNNRLAALHRAEDLGLL